MRQAFTLMLLMVATALVSGCIKSENQLLIKKDGTGEVNVTLLMSEQLLAMSQKDPNAELFTQEDLEKMAKTFGDDVTVASSEPFKANGYQGIKAKFAVPDITKLNFKRTMGPEQGGDAAGGEEEKSGYAFAIAEADGVHTLTITPVGEVDDAPAEEPAPVVLTDKKKQELLQQKTMLAGFMINMTVKVEGEVLKTNASFPVKEGGNEYYLINLNIDKMSLETISMLDSMEEDGPANGMDKEGFRAESPNKTITIDFK